MRSCLKRLTVTFGNITDCLGFFLFLSTKALK
jgi:hypothetical protein